MYAEGSVGRGNNAVELGGWLDVARDEKTKSTFVLLHLGTDLRIPSMKRKLSRVVGWYSHVTLQCG